MNNGDAGVDHGGKLAGEHHQIRQLHLAALGLAALGHFFLDLDHQQIAVEQRGDGGLFRKRLDGVADFAARGRFSGSVGKYGHGGRGK